MILRYFNYSSYIHSRIPNFEALHCKRNNDGIIDLKRNSFRTFNEKSSIILTILFIYVFSQALEEGHYFFRKFP